MLWWILLFVLVVYILTVNWKIVNYWNVRGVIQIKPLSFLGNLSKNLFQRVSFADQIQLLYNYYPDAKYVGLHQFITPILMLRDPELVKLITVRHFDNFIDHKAIFTEDIDPLFGKNLISLSGQRWKDMRSTLSPAFTSSKMRAMYVLIKECAEQFVDYFHKEAECENGLVTVEMKDILTRYANDVIATSAFGIKVDSLKNKTNEFYITGKKCTTFGLVTTLKFFGYVSFAPVMKLLKVKLFATEIEQFFRSLIKTTIETREREGIVRPDMIHLLMEARKGRLTHETTSHGKDEDAGFATVQESSVGKEENFNKSELTNDDITAQALLFFIAGYDTSSTMMSFLAHELAVNPEIQNKLQDEVDDTMERCNGNIDYESLLKMKYLDMVICENLRKWPPAVITDRLCSKPYTLIAGDKSIQLDKDLSLWVPVFCLHRDPRYFEDPERFDPERFSDENKNNITPFTYLPFGAGPRNCIGSRFALLEIKALYVHLLSKFEITVVEKTQIPIKLDKQGFNMRAENGFWLGLRPRK